MSRRYRRYSSRKGSSGGNPLGLLVLLAFFFFFQHWKLILAIALIAIAGILLWRYLKKQKQIELPSGEAASPTLSGETVAPAVNSEKTTYTSKTSLMTECEKGFFDAIKKIASPKYIVQPQINLASIINKESHSKYQNELFRNIDFGILDQNYKLLVLIEINDATHTERNRRERDQKVQTICKEAGIPLITFWTKYGVNESYIKQQLAKYLELEITSPEM